MISVLLPGVLAEHLGEHGLQGTVDQLVLVRRSVRHDLLGPREQSDDRRARHDAGARPSLEENSNATRPPSGSSVIRMLIATDSHGCQRSVAAPASLTSRPLDRHSRRDDDLLRIGPTVTCHQKSPHARRHGHSIQKFVNMSGGHSEPLPADPNFPAELQLRPACASRHASAGCDVRCERLAQLC